MIPLESAAVFFAASIVLAITPGPDNIFVLTQSALYGRQAGFWVTAGLCTGLLVHTTAVALGVAAIVQSSSLAFNTLKMIGAIYLLYLAWRAFRAGVTNFNQPKAETLTRRGLYLRGIIMNLTNPKVGIFFLAFLPQFAEPSRGSLAIQVSFYGGLFILAALLTFGAIAWSAGYFGERLAKSERGQVLINRIAGSVFVVLALRVAISER